MDVMEKAKELIIQNPCIVELPLETTNDIRSYIYYDDHEYPIMLNYNDIRNHVIDLMAKNNIDDYDLDELMLFAANNHKIVLKPDPGEIDVIMYASFMNPIGGTFAVDNINNDKTYIGLIYKYVKEYVNRNEFINSINDASGDLFFVFCVTSLKEYKKIIKTIKNNNNAILVIKKGTCYGFFLDPMEIKNPTITTFKKDCKIVKMGNGNGFIEIGTIEWKNRNVDKYEDFAGKMIVEIKTNEED